MSPHRSAAWPLSGVAVVLIVYASLYPMTGWRWPSPQAFSWILPKLGSETLDDVVANLLGYVPMGMVLCLAHLRSGRSAMAAACWTSLACSALSYSMELLQFTVPGRVPSLADWVLNSLGAGWGVLAAISLQACGLLDRWHRLRQEWFITQSSHGLALLGIWPWGLLFPPPLPMGEGQVLPRLRVALMEWTHDSPLQPYVLPQDPLTLWSSIHSAVVDSPWVYWVEVAVVACGVLAPMAMVVVVARPLVLRTLLMVALMLTGVSVMTLTAALNYGPAHALGWLNSAGLLGLALAAVMAHLLARLRARQAAWLGLVALATLIVCIHLVPPDPYYAVNLQAWESGRFIRLHGMSRWFGMLWPYVAATWLLGRLHARDDDLVSNAS